MAESRRENKIEGNYPIKNLFFYENILYITNQYVNINQNQKTLLHTHYSGHYQKKKKRKTNKQQQKYPQRITSVGKGVKKIETLLHC